MAGGGLRRSFVNGYPQVNDAQPKTQTEISDCQLYVQQTA